MVFAKSVAVQTTLQHFYKAKLQFRAGQTSPNSCCHHQLLIINSTLVPGGHSPKSTPSASPVTLAEINREYVQFEEK
jgi:hypothetical protein